jgi:hypothetical protein
MRPRNARRAEALGWRYEAHLRGLHEAAFSYQS